MRLFDIKVKLEIVLAPCPFSGDEYALTLKVLSSKTVSLEVIISGDEKQEKFTFPEFCSS
jgi:uncharacterized protein YqfB (UPF0267 family)